MFRHSLYSIGFIKRFIFVYYNPHRDLASLTSFSDTELTEDAIEDVLDADPPGDPAERARRQAQVLGQQGQLGIGCAWRRSAPSASSALRSAARCRLRVSSGEAPGAMRSAGDRAQRRQQPLEALAGATGEAPRRDALDPRALPAAGSRSALLTTHEGLVVDQRQGRRIERRPERAVEQQQAQIGALGRARARAARPPPRPRRPASRRPAVSSSVTG